MCNKLTHSNIVSSARRSHTNDNDIIAVDLETLRSTFTRENLRKHRSSQDAHFMFLLLT